MFDPKTLGFFKNYMDKWGVKPIDIPREIKFSNNKFPGKVYALSTELEPVYFFEPDESLTPSQIKAICAKGRHQLQRPYCLFLCGHSANDVMVGVFPYLEEEAWGHLNLYKPIGADEAILNDMTLAARKKTFPDKLAAYRKALDYQALSKRFFADAKKWKDSFEKEIKAHFIKSKQKANDQSISHFSIILMSRFIFIHVLERQNMLNKDHLYIRKRVLGTDDCEPLNDLYNQIFKDLFFTVFALPYDKRPSKFKNEQFPYLNSSLFSSYEDVEDTKAGKSFSLSDSVIRGFHEDCLYKYRITIGESTDHNTSQLDPELLGSVFERFMKDDAQSSSGSFYTPKLVVTYTVRQTLYKVFREKGLGEKDAFELIYPDDKGERKISNKEADKAFDIIDRLKVLEPCCGSGAFLLSVLEEIHAIIGVIKEAQGIVNWKRRDAYERILTKNIFAMDISPEAIILAQLRLWLPIIGLIKTDKTALHDIKPLPNLNLNIQLGNTLFTKDAHWDISPVDKGNIDQMRVIRTQYTRTKGSEVKILEKKFAELSQIDPDQPSPVCSFADIIWGKDIKRSPGFDIVIGNPPYLGAKDSAKIPYLKERDAFELNRFNGNQDLYIFFTQEGYRFLNDGGVLSYVTSDSYFTDLTKTSFRKMLMGKEDDFEICDLCICKLDDATFDAAVSTSVLSFQMKESQAKSIEFVFTKDSAKNKSKTVNPHLKGFVEDRQRLKVKTSETHIRQKIAPQLLEKVPNLNFFLPTAERLNFIEEFGNQWKSLYDGWWTKIKSTADFARNRGKIDMYINALKPGDMTLIGLTCEGGQGLATACNAQHLAFMEGTPQADKLKNKIMKARLDIQRGNGAGKKLIKSQEKIQKTIDNLLDHEHPYAEAEFDFIHKIVPQEQVVDVSKLLKKGILKNSDIENIKYYGFSKSLCKKLGLKYPAYVPCYKGDPAGNRWVGSVPCYIDWGEENVAWLASNCSGNWGSGRPRNWVPEHFFKTGFGWNKIFTDKIKTRFFQNLGVAETGCNPLYSIAACTSNKYCLAVINSSLMDELLKIITTTSNMQINDVKPMPIFVPTQEQHNRVVQLVDQIIDIKTKEDYNPSQASLEKIKKLEEQIDEIILEVFGMGKKQYKGAA